MKKSKRSLSLFLAACLALGTLISCGESKNTAEDGQAKTGAESPETPVNAAPAEEEAEAETEDPIAARTLPDTVPELDFGGAEFRSISQDGLSAMDIWTEGESGEVLNDAVFRRNKAVEERFNVTIAEPVAVRYTVIGTQVTSLVKAGEDAYELILGQMEESGKNMVAGHFMNWYDVPYMDFTQPWYPDSIVQEGVGTVNGKMYIAVSDMLLTYIKNCWAIVYDHVYANNYGITGVYDLVKNGEWTLDRLIGFTGEIYEDRNGNGEKDDEDFYGLSYRVEGCSFAASLYGLGVRSAQIEDKQLVMTLYSEHTVDVFDKIFDMLENTGTLKAPYNGKYTEALFSAGCSVFANLALTHCYNNLREYENPYGIIPLPKWDEQQERYCTTPDGGSNIMAVMLTAQNTELIGAVTEALSAESWRSVMPVFIDTILSSKIARDRESTEMIDLVLDSIYVDFPYLYDGFQGWTFKLSTFVEKRDALASTYAKQEKLVAHWYESVVKKFYD